MTKIKDLPWIKMLLSSTPEEMEKAFNDVSNKKCRIKFVGDDGESKGVLIPLEEYNTLKEELARLSVK